MAEITAPMPGKIFEIKVNPGDSVEEGETVLVLEAMKMEMPIVTTAAGTVKEVKYSVGEAVEGETVLMIIE